MLNLVLSNDAEADLAKIAEFTILNFGIIQAQKYYSGISNALNTLAKYPDLGIDHNEIKPGLKRFIYQSHTIYFSVKERELFIYRILNHKQDPLALLN